MLESRKWVFQVSCEVKSGEQVYVVGSCEELGSWDSQKPLALHPEVTSDMSTDTEVVWKTTVNLPCHEVQYRFCVSTCLNRVEECTISYAVMRWETSLIPRKAPANCSNFNDPTVELFGCHGEREKIGQGWLVSESLIQLKLFPSDIYKEPIVLWNRKYKGKKCYVKVTPLDISKNIDRNSSVECSLDESTEVELTQLRMQSKVSWPTMEVAVMMEGHCQFCRQEQFGVECSGNEMIMFQCRSFLPSTIEHP